MRAYRFWRSLAAVDANSHTVGVSGKADALGSCADPQPFGLQNLPDALRHILIFTGDESRRPFDDGDVRAEAPEHLRELQADITAADHDEVPRHPIQRQDGGVGEIRHVVDARHVGHEGTAADVDEDSRRGQLLLADAHRVRSFEPRVALDDRAAIHVSQPLLHARAGIGGNGGGPRLDPAHVDLHATVDHDAEVGGAAREMRRVRARDKCFGRHAPCVHAGAAEELALHERDRHAGAGETAGERRSSLSGSNDDGVEALHGSAAIMRAAGSWPAGISSPSSRRWRPPEPLR